MNWTDQDIDAAYFLGVMRGSGFTPKDSDFPLMDAIRLDIDAFQSAGYKNPSEMVKEIRYAKT